MSKSTLPPNFKKYTAIVGDTKHYESGAAVTLMTAINGATLAIFGVPAARKGGPAKGQLVDVAVVELLDEAGGVSARNYAGLWAPSGMTIKMADIPSGNLDAPTPRAVFQKPEGYQRKAASIADELAPTPTPETAPVA